MKKSVKKAGALLLAMVSILSTAAFPASATSVTGTVGGHIGCTGSNSITRINATATTTASEPATAVVTLYYYCKETTTGALTDRMERTNSNSPTTRVTVLLENPSPSHYDSFYCQSKHRVSSGGLSWNKTTGFNYY